MLYTIVWYVIYKFQFSTNISQDVNKKYKWHGNTLNHIYEKNQ